MSHKPTHPIWKQPVIRKDYETEKNFCIIIFYSVPEALSDFKLLTQKNQ